MAIHQEHKAKRARHAARSRRQKHSFIHGPAAQPELGVPHVLQRAVTQPERMTPGNVQRLQHTFGNRAITGLLPGSRARLPVQAKLTINPTGDRYEREADRMAGQVMSTLDAGQHRVQRQEEEETVQTQALSSAIQRLSGSGGMAVAPEMEVEIQQARGGGQRLSGDVREPMERAFGADFGGVRVHTGARADALSHSLQARAFTTGRDIFFRSGEYSPGSSSGKKLIAHELTHTRQQGASGRLARWGGKDGQTKHSEVTRTALGGLDQKWRSVYEKPGVARYLELFSHRMDAREVCTSEWKLIGASKQTKLRKSMQKSAEAWRTKAGEKRSSEEDKNHAETGGYRNSGGYDDTYTRIYDWVARAGDEAIAGNANEAFMFLGLALHTAEDIGAHGFGEPGKGHDPHLWVKPPELKKGENKPKEFGKYTGQDLSDCDRKEKNSGGFKTAVKEAKDVLRYFARFVKKSDLWKDEIKLEPRYAKKLFGEKSLQGPRYEWTKFGPGKPDEKMVEKLKTKKPWSPGWSSLASIADNYA